MQSNDSSNMRKKKNNDLNNFECGMIVGAGGQVAMFQKGGNVLSCTRTLSGVYNERCTCKTCFRLSSCRHK